MKKTLAAISAASLGLVGAAAGAAAPAAAALPADCTSTQGHVLSATATGAEDWYMDCTPLYGLGKSQFTIDAGPDGFPADFQALDTATVTSTATATSTGAAVDAYTGRTASDPAGMTSLVHTTTSATTQTYASTVIVPIDRASLRKLDAAAPLGGCVGSTYNAAYSYSTLATTTTFTEIAGGETWTFDITTPASVNYLYLNLVLGASASFDPTQSQCATDGTVAGTISAADGASANYRVITGSKATSSFSTLSPFYSDEGQLGTFSRVAAAPAPAPVPAPALAEPILAATGTDATLPAVLAAALLAAGASIALIARRRRSVA